MAGTDILQANGAMVDNVQLYHSEVTYKEPLLMFRNVGKGQFEKVSESLGPDFMRPIAGRGLATADFDNDGDIDIAVNNRGDYPELLRNDGGNANHWLEVLLIGTSSNRDGIGASLKLTSEGFVASRTGKRRHELHVGKRSANSLWSRKAHQNRIAGNYLAERPSGSLDERTHRPDHRGKRRHGNCRRRNSPRCPADDACDSARRRFLGSSAVVLGSTLLDALTTPLWKWNRSAILQADHSELAALRRSPSWM